MFDLHSHILFDVDDGAKNIDDSINIIKSLKELGIKDVFITPHFIDYGISAGADDVLNKFNELKQEIENKNIGINLYIGQEILSSMEIIQLLQERRVFTLNNSNFVLIELPLNIIPIYLDNMIFELRRKKYIPIIAHPERYNEVKKEPNIVYEMINKGCLMQVNTGSFAGMYGEETKKTAVKLLNHKMIHFLGSDVHSIKQMSLCKKGIEVINNIIDKEYFEKLTIIHPKHVLNNLYFTPNEPSKIEEKKGRFIFRLKRKK